MEHDGGDVTADAAESDVPAAPTRTETVAGPRRRRRLAVDLTALGVIGILLIGAIGATGAVLYRQLYSPTAFVLDYLHLLADGRATDALLLPGVSASSSQLAAAKLPADASGALLRGSALTRLTDVEPVSETTDADGTTTVTVTYRVGGHSGTTTFDVERDDDGVLLPRWRFAESPLAVIELEVRGSMQFEVNGFSVDKRQVSPDGADADPLEPIPLLAFSPGLYSITVDTAATSSPGVAVLSDTPLAEIPVSFQAEPTDKFLGVVQQEVDDFLAQCATQKVLQPTGCPFGYYVRNRIVEPPTWKIEENPVVTLEPDGAGWAITRTQAVAKIDVQIRSIFDGSVYAVEELVPFFLTGKITILPDGTASIAVSAAD
ncbi:hypothetical protein [Microbacterium oleivorans]|uniref:Uncharacterized protein n=1 Tax=Microbacterium oleivorans TaxID=273677 RepID=A0A4R5YRG9_9MICO|nr:hypothetical protein [Microbacterium oleivorans]TDL45967.1 hypothetical protein E2R54_05900 [Microbacterium oleivorans]